MKAIIIGNNGKLSMRSVLKDMNRNDVFLFIKDKKNIWSKENLVNNSISKTKVSKPSFNDGDIIIKWGNSIPLVTNQAIYYNNGKAISNSSNKLEARFLMEEANIPIPETFGNISDIDSFPVIVRPIKHKAGKHFYIANNESHLMSLISKYSSLSAGFYMSKIFNKDREFRLHCVLGKVLVIKEKPAPNDKSQIAWNFALTEEEWTTIERKNYNLKMCKIALQAMDAIGLDIGAVDIMSKGEEHVVCEINTAPSLTPYLSSKYAMLFNKLFNENHKIEKWNYNVFERGSSLSWKNYQMMDQNQSV